MTTTATFVAGSPNATLSSFNVNPNVNVLANGLSPMNLTVQSRDASGNPTPGTQVTFSGSGSGNTFRQRVALTNASGVATAQVTSTKGQTETLTAQFAGITFNANGTFYQKPPDCAGTSLFPGVPTPGATASQPNSVVMADFNNDGYLDFAVGNSNSVSVSVYLGLGTGLMNAPVTYTASPNTYLNSANTGPSLVNVADFNNDGIVDIIATNTSYNTVSVLQGTGSGSFATARIIPMGTAPMSAIAVDVNGDGKQDLVAVSNTSNTVMVSLGNGNFSFSAATSVGIDATPVFVTAGDVNGDNIEDLLVACANSTGMIDVLYGNGNGTFTIGNSVTANNRPFVVK
ncbi:MAG: hypothetical protein EOO39_43890, partial [Cytophagaceae bacterium]